MYCCNCGNKLDDNAVVCVKCGVSINNNNLTVNNSSRKKESNHAGIISIIIGIISFCLTIKVMTNGIGNISMMNMEEKVVYGIKLVINPFIWAFISFLSAIGSKNRNRMSNIIGLSLSLLTIFFLLTEIVMVFLV